MQVPKMVYCVLNMLVALFWVIVSLVIMTSIGKPLMEENVPIKKLTIQDKVVYKMRHDFWPKTDQRNGILPFLEIISRRRRSSEDLSLNNTTTTSKNYDNDQLNGNESISLLEDPIEGSNTESTLYEEVMILDLDEAENTLIFRPLFAYRHKKRRQKLKQRIPT